MAQIPLSDKAYIEIKELIRNGKYLPGEQLPEEELSDLLKMSRTPIRAALQRLQEDMIVSIKPRMGAVVATLDLSQLCNLYETREAIEGMVARLNCKKANNLSAYESLLREYEMAQKIEDETERMNVSDDLTYKYVELLSRGCNNPILAKMMLSVQEKVHSLDKVSHIIPIFPDIGAKERMAVLRAIISKDEQESENMARLRIRNCLKRILDAAMPH